MLDSQDYKKELFIPDFAGDYARLLDSPNISFSSSFDQKNLFSAKSEDSGFLQMIVASALVTFLATCLAIHGKSMYKERQMLA